jgi:hypothetical protein
MGAGAEQTAARGVTTNVTCALMLAVEALGSLAMWAVVPLAWLWVGGRVYALTGSLGLDMLVAFAGFVATLVLVVRMLRRVDAGWITLRRRAGYDQKEGALTQIVTVSATLAFVLFLAWYYLISHAYIIPFMPSN